MALDENPLENYNSSTFGETSEAGLVLFLRGRGIVALICCYLVRTTVCSGEWMFFNG